MRFLFACLLPAIFLAPHPAYAGDDGLNVSGSVRGRVEAIDGQFRPDAAGDDIALLLRTDIAAEYDAGTIRIGGELIDSRAYFERRDSSIGTAEVNAVEPVHAYITADLSDRARLTLGRFTMALGSQRLVARANFRNTTNAFTGARFDWTAPGGTSATLFWTMPQRRQPTNGPAIRDNGVELDEEGGAQQFFGGALTLPGLPDGGSLDLYAYRLAEHDAPGFATQGRHLVTTGARLHHAPEPRAIDYDVEGAWQTGRRNAAGTAGTDQDVDAWLLHAEIGKTFAGKWSPRIALLYDHASGDEAGGDYGRFDSLFGSRAHDFGPTSLYGPVGRSNLDSPALRAEATPGDRWDAMVTARLLRLASASDAFANTGVRDPDGRSGTHAGVQVDARLRYWLAPKRARLAVGAALLAKGHFLHAAPNAPATGDTRYGYVQVTVSF